MMKEKIRQSCAKKAQRKMSRIKICEIFSNSEFFNNLCGALSFLKETKLKKGKNILIEKTSNNNAKPIVGAIFKLF